MRIKYDLRSQETPYIDGEIVHVSKSWGTTHVYVDTENFIAVDSYETTSNSFNITWYFFLNNKIATWDDLNDERRWQVRNAAKKEVNNLLWKWYNPGEYRDDSWETLEVLGGL